MLSTEADAFPEPRRFREIGARHFALGTPEASNINGSSSHGDINFLSNRNDSAGSLSCFDVRE